MLAEHTTKGDAMTHRERRILEMEILFRDVSITIEADDATTAYRQIVEMLSRAKYWTPDVYTVYHNGNDEKPIKRGSVFDLAEKGAK